MKRTTVTHRELLAVKTVLQEALQGRPRAVVPMERITAVLERPDPNRIVWSRSFRSFFSEIGIKAGIRNRQQAYVFTVVDPLKLSKAMAGSGVHGPEISNGHQQTANRANSESGFFFPSWADHVRKSIQAGERVMLVGPTGCGKTELIRALAKQESANLLRVNLHGDISAMDLVGQYKITEERQMVFQPGPLVRAMQTPNTWLNLDEIDAAVPQALFVLQSVLEDRPTLFVPELGETITPREGFRIIATANTIGKGDDSGLYAGTNVLNESFLDRFHCVFSVDYLPPPDERKVILGKAPQLGSPTATRMIKVANDLRKALKDGTVYSTFSTRRLIAWASKTVQIGDAKQASIYTVMNRIGMDDRKVFEEVFQRHGF